MGYYLCLAWRKDRLKDITNQRAKSNNRSSVRLTLCLFLVTLMLTSPITTTIVYASSPNSTSLSSTGSGSSTPSNDKSKINSRSDSSGRSAGSGSSSGGGSTAHCDRPGYPSCFSLGNADGKNHPVTSCPGGHSQNYCNGYGGWNWKLNQ